MLGTFSALSSKVKINYKKVRLDNAVFRLHYNATTMFLIGACILVTSTQYIGSPIQCIMNNKKAPGAINTYCWIASTFTIPYQNHKRVGTEVAHDGVGPVEYIRNPETGQLEEAGPVHYHAYYQWVPFVLFLQAIMFYFPHYLWKTFDGGKVRTVVDSGCSYSMKESDRHEKRKLLTQYVANHIRRHNIWYYQFVFCEILNFVNVVGQIFFTDKFLGNTFTKFGIKVTEFLEVDPEDRTDPMMAVFPRVTKCTWHQYGPSGTVVRQDTLCVLAWNIINEKIYVFLWFWFVILAVVTGCALIYRLVSLVWMPIRSKVLLLQNAAAKDEVESVLSRCRVGDWYFLSHISTQMDPRDFKKFLQMLAEELKVGTGDPATLEMTSLYPKAEKA